VIHFVVVVAVLLIGGLRGEPDEAALISQVIQWAKNNGAYISPKVEVLQIAGSLSGIFAREEIEEGEIISTIPWDLILKPEGEESGFCEVLSVAHESISKNGNLQTPYEKYLATRTRHHVPVFWSRPGQDVLLDLLGDRLPTCGFDIAVDYWWTESCKREEVIGEQSLNAMMLALTRGDGPTGTLLVPFSDVINHDNGAGLNTGTLIKDGESHELFTLRRVHKGEQLQISYNRCTWCGDVYSNPPSVVKFFVTPKLFEWYGFIELPPQRWVFSEARLIVDIDTNGDDGKKQAKFAVPPSGKGLAFINEELNRLKGFEQKYKNQTSTARDSIPEIEWSAIWQYYDTVVDVLKLAVDGAKGQRLSDEVWELDEDDWYFEENGESTDDDEYWEEDSSDEDHDNDDDDVEDETFEDQEDVDNYGPGAEL